MRGAVGPTGARAKADENVRTNVGNCLSYVDGDRDKLTRKRGRDKDLWKVSDVQFSL